MKHHQLLLPDFLDWSGRVKKCIESKSISLNLSEYTMNTPWIFNIAPENIRVPSEKERLVFQPSFSRGETLNFGRVYTTHHNTIFCHQGHIFASHLVCAWHVAANSLRIHLKRRACPNGSTRHDCIKKKQQNHLDL